LKVLVIGSAGNLGTRLCEDLARSGHTVYGIARPGAQINSSIHNIEMDLRDLKLDLLPRIDCVYYLAQSKYYRDFPNQWEDIFEINIAVPLKLVDWARKSGVPAFHYLSSGGVYQGGIAAVRETAEINANRDVGFYIGSRLSAEILIRNFSTFFETFSIIRPFFIYGPNQPKTMLIPRLIENIKNGREIVLSGENGIKINPIFVDDASQACQNLLKLKGFYALNIAGQEILTIRDIANQISTKLNLKPIFKHVPESGQDLVGDTDLMFSLLHKPKKSFIENVMEMLNDY